MSPAEWSRGSYRILRLVGGIPKFVIEVEGVPTRGGGDIPGLLPPLCEPLAVEYR